MYFSISHSPVFILLFLSCFSLYPSSPACISPLFAIASLFPPSPFSFSLLLQSAPSFFSLLSPFSLLLSSLSFSSQNPTSPVCIPLLLSPCSLLRPSHFYLLSSPFPSSLHPPSLVSFLPSPSFFLLSPAPVCIPLL